MKRFQLLIGTILAVAMVFSGSLALFAAPEPDGTAPPAQTATPTDPAPTDPTTPDPTDPTDPTAPTDPPPSTNVYTTPPASPPAGAYAVIANPPAAGLTLVQDSLGSIGSFADAIWNSSSGAIRSFIRDNPAWERDARWWELYLADSAGAEVPLNSSATIYLPVSVNTGSYDYLLVHGAPGGLEVLNPVVTGRGIQFTVSSLSPFALLRRDRSEGGRASYDAFWNKVERYIRVARDGEYLEVSLPYYIYTVPDYVLEALEKSRVTLAVNSAGDRRIYRLYGPDIDESRLVKRDYELYELYALVGAESSVESYDYSYDANPTTGGDGYQAISSSGGNLNPGTGAITLFSDSRTIDPLPDLDETFAAVETFAEVGMSDSDRSALQILIVFFGLAAVLPVIERVVSGRKEEKLARLAARKRRRGRG